jgi:hypothetical protein
LRANSRTRHADPAARRAPQGHPRLTNRPVVAPAEGEALPADEGEALLAQLARRSAEAAEAVDHTGQTGPQQRVVLFCAGEAESSGAVLASAVGTGQTAATGLVGPH